MDRQNYLARKTFNNTSKTSTRKNVNSSNFIPSKKNKLDIKIKKNK